MHQTNLKPDRQPAKWRDHRSFFFEINLHELYKIRKRKYIHTRPRRRRVVKYLRSKPWDKQKQVSSSNRRDIILSNNSKSTETGWMNTNTPASNNFHTSSSCVIKASVPHHLRGFFGILSTVFRKRAFNQKYTYTVGCI